jgi:H+/Cl- antiporter ClcA
VPQPQTSPSTGDYVRLIALGALVGIPAALAAAVFIGLVHETQNVLWSDLPDALGADGVPWYLILGLPLVGAAVVYVVRTYLPGDGGHSPLEGLKMGPIPLSWAPGIALAAFATLSCGIVLGPEAPVIALGAIAASAISSFAKLEGKALAVIAMAGSFAAISALFGGPIVGGILLVEAGIGLGAALIPALLPGFVAAAIGYVIFEGLDGWGGLSAPGLTLPDLPAYDGTSVLDLVAAVGVGIAAALMLGAIRPLARRMAAVGGSRLGLGALLATGALAIGLITLLADALGADSQDVLFSGQSSTAVLVASSAGIIIVLLVAKGLAYAVSMASGFRGGPIFPAVFIGVGLASLPVAWFDLSPTFAIAAGAAAGMAAQTKLILASMLFGALLVGSAGFDAIPGSVLAAVAAWVVTTALEPTPPPPVPSQEPG